MYLMSQWKELRGRGADKKTAPNCYIGCPSFVELLLGSGGREANSMGRVCAPNPSAILIIRIADNRRSVNRTLFNGDKIRGLYFQQGRRDSPAACTGAVRPALRPVGAFCLFRSYYGPGRSCGNSVSALAARAGDGRPRQTPRDAKSRGADRRSMRSEGISDAEASPGGICAAACAYQQKADLKP